MAHLCHSVTLITETVLESEPGAVGNGLSLYNDYSILWGHQMLPQRAVASAGHLGKRGSGLPSSPHHAVRQAEGIRLCLLGCQRASSHSCITVQSREARSSPAWVLPVNVLAGHCAQVTLCPTTFIINTLVTPTQRDVPVSPPACRGRSVAIFAPSCFVSPITQAG